MNDCQIKSFNDWTEVVNFLLESGCCPTVIIYERQILTEPVSFKDVTTKRSMLNEDQLKALSSVASGMEEDIEFFKN